RIQEQAVEVVRPVVMEPDTPLCLCLTLKQTLAQGGAARNGCEPMPSPAAGGAPAFEPDGFAEIALNFEFPSKIGHGSGVRIRGKDAFQAFRISDAQSKG